MTPATGQRAVDRSMIWQQNGALFRPFASVVFYRRNKDGDRVTAGVVTFCQSAPKVGLHGKLGMHWALGAFESSVKAAETGVMFDIFPGKVPLLIEHGDIKNNFYYFKFYLSLQLGSRKRIGEE